MPQHMWIRAGPDSCVGPSSACPQVDTERAEALPNICFAKLLCPLPCLVNNINFEFSDENFNPHFVFNTHLVPNM